MVSAMAFCASSSGVRRAASRATKSLIVASSSQAFPTSSMDGPAHTAATEISGTLIWLHGQSGNRGSAASDVPRKATSMARAIARDRHLMCRLQAANVDQTRRTSCDLICVRWATLPDVPTRIGKTIMERHEGMLDNLHDGPVTCVGAWVSQHFGNSSQKSPLVKGSRAQLPQPCHHRT